MNSPHAAQPSILVRRVGAYFIDIAILFVVLAPLGYLVQLAIDISPVSAREIYVTLFLNFSIPCWAYFVFADRSRRGATLGKRWLSLRTQTETGGRVGTGQALLRTAVKMIPWELTHASSFLFAPRLGELSAVNYIGIGIAYALIFYYLFLAWRSRGSRSAHDFVASTCVTPVLEPTATTAV